MGPEPGGDEEARNLLTPKTKKLRGERIQRILAGWLIPHPPPEEEPRHASTRARIRARFSLTSGCRHSAIIKRAAAKGEPVQCKACNVNKTGLKIKQVIDQGVIMFTLACRRPERR